MKIHYLQHVAFESPGTIQEWVNGRDHQCSCTVFHQNDVLPDILDIDWLVVMGGPMNVNETHLYPWLRKEKEYIKAAIKHDRAVLGICLGAQLIAAVLEANIVKNPVREIGWYPVNRAAELANHQLAGVIPEELEVFHWHGDTFTMPEGAVRIAGSNACANQGFVYRDRVIALQFHLESTSNGVRQLIDNCRDEIVAGPYIQTPEQMLSDESRFREINELMFRILEYQESLIK